MHSENIYNTDEELIYKICWAITNHQKLNQCKLATISEKFDWQVIAPEYDKKLEAIL